MIKGKYLFIDIGAGETKIVEAVVKKYSVVVLKTAEMRDMSLFVSDRGTIRQIEGFCQSLKQTLNDADISTKNVILCSSILNFSSKEITSEFKSVKDCINSFDKSYGRTTNFSLIHDWQYMGDSVSATEIQQKLYLFSGAVDLLKSIISTMQSIAGLNIISIEPSLSATCNIHYLYQPTYDMPSICIADLGKDSVHCTIFKNDSLVSTTEITNDFFNLDQHLADRFEIPLPKMRNILYNVGAVISDKNKALLAEVGISHEAYYSVIQDACKELVKEMQRTLTNLAATKRLENVKVIFCGGQTTMPGLSELIQKYYTFTPCCVFEVESSFDSKTFRIINKTNHILHSKFMVCLGLTLKNFNTQHSVNLVPKELLVVDSGRVIKTTLAALCTLGAVSIAAVIGLNIPNVMHWIDLLNESSESSTITSRYSQVLAECNTLQDYVTNLKSINSSLTPFISFVNSCENKNLRIASIDTSNVLEVSVQTGQGTIESSNVNTLEGLVIRGYALSSEDITDFYEKLVRQENVHSVNMNGIREVSLGVNKDNLKDVIYIFELEVDIND